MRGIFTRDERVVVLFIALSLAVGSLVLAARRVDPTLAPASPEPWQTAGGGASSEAAADRPVDVNAATVEELTELPGIGPVRAAAIVRLRESRGRFGSVDELLDVRGIGPVTLERLRPLAVAGSEGFESPRERASAVDSLVRGSETPR